MSVREAELLLLGTGTSSGIPVIGCTCDVCRSPDPRDRRLRSGAALRFTDAAGSPRCILLDCPPDHREQALRHGLQRCDAIFFTHNHVDHTFGLDEVRRYNALMDAPIDVWGDERTLEHLERVYRHIFRSHENVNDSFVATLIPRRLEADRAVEFLGLRLTPFQLLHGKLPVLGFRVEPLQGGAAGGLFPLAYCTDVNAIPPASWRHLQGVRTLVLDMLRYRRHPTHFTVDQAVEVAGRVGAAQTVFVHMTHDILHADLDPRLPPGMRLGYDGLRLPDAPAIG
ncbi:MAG: MBL fold metallo-hydrolase [Phycisphaerales bacterium]